MALSILQIRILISLMTITFNTGFCTDFQSFLLLRTPNPINFINQSTTSSLASINSPKDKISYEVDFAEKHVTASANAKVDLDRIVRALQNDEPTKVRGDLVMPGDVSASTSPLMIALAGASLASFIAYMSFGSPYISIVIFILFFVTAIDPMKSENIAGAVTRMVGRSTLKSVADVQPKLKSVARALVTQEEEVVALKNKIYDLENEISELRIWKINREKVDSAISKYSLKDLKDLARNSSLPVTGTKFDLIFRLLEADILRL